MIQVTPEQCELFYPFVIGVNNAGKIVYLSQPLMDRLGADQTGKPFLSVFDLRRPRIDKTVEQINLLEHRSQLLLFSDVTRKLGLRGQVVPGQYEGQPIALIAASSWLTWLNEHVEDYQPKISDFSIPDAQLDLNLHLQTQSIMLEDLRNLTEQLTKARDEAELASSAKSTFVSHVTHELRTPLTGIAGLIEIMDELPLDAEVKDIVGDLKASSDHLMQVVNQVLDFSRLKESGDELLLQMFDPVASVSESIALLQPLAKAKNLLVDNRFDPNLPKLVNGDVLKIQKALINLLSNAIKYSNRGQINVVVMVKEKRDGRSRLRFQVEDEGPGVSEADRPNLFKEFWTKDAPGTNQVASTGLGLCITRELVEAMGGQVGMQPKRTGTGSEFWFEIELEVCPDTAEIRGQPDLTGTEFYDARLLVVDDNRVNRRVVSLMLEKFGTAVDQVTSGREAIDVAQKNHYDLILMDIQMPEIDGLKAAEQIRLAAGGDCPPIIAWSANCTEDDIAGYKAVGMSGALTKPVTRLGLATMLKQYLPAPRTGKV
ncbi:MAG: response regulator [Planctomycetota bacterium]|nr:response regulator [Planctomycetota bacterium]